MSAAGFDHRRTRWISLVAFSSVALGCTGLLLCTVYEGQRSGMFLHSFYRLDRFMQQHLGGIAGSASVCGLLGFVLGIVSLKSARQPAAGILGILISVAALLWSMLFLRL